ncbi:sulfur metabolite repression control protein SconB, putative [Talaromyces stipitatus ATCC 10500]|uniref:Probable E3 ubiquitin ligase complex SCF subunit sconB n=1 Tax=Talaromyces stipitatus (strain ATCC 10500 / CBS 375.48 / QM 6759 / NRRL 1006) TaxID=441959 RepID=SCONB_TALSN|nr:sulfur metabolite repression control protein SconB, putative [Talaromyces stipitatus ATCC 10500]B8M7Q5.1 RecName: Full=Probable E3 ubiquitin ligase complex SCF subunit sconB; AltName: Full=Sulfur controller B; AltName: Full=Sulfur metabolite repression control protein B [Talaromyces stipitatus ATCC 10500]EED19784.1 sulfur metabolite repression control protein SconB, putative [Talaromyces stipitatus ATCC 10500]
MNGSGSTAKESLFNPTPRKLGLPEDNTMTPYNGVRSIFDNSSGSRQLTDEHTNQERAISKAKLADENIAPFLAKHIPSQYAPLGADASKTTGPPRPMNSRYCYRHRPDLKCRRQADEPSMDHLQWELQSLSQSDQQGIAHVWSLFSAAPAKQRELMLRGILAQCCFPQLSLISSSVRDLIRIDFITALPPEISFKILSYLDTASLCRAAQVSRAWKCLADDDVVWHRMCEQHIHRKCTKCGWGLPLLERKRLRASKEQIEKRALGVSVAPDSSTIAVQTVDATSGVKRTAEDLEGSDSQVVKRQRLPTEDTELHRTNVRPWKDVYKDRFKVGTNWKYGRCSVKVFKGHTNGVMCLQFEDNILATGSYDMTIKIWDMETGEELRTLTGHTSGIRCLQFDDTKLISGSIDRTLKVWNWRTGECISTYTGHLGGIIGLHFENSVLASGSIDNTVKIWNFEDKSTFLLRGHSDWVNAVRVDSASRTVLSASDDCTVKLWDLDSKQCIRTFQGHVGQVQQVIPLPKEFEFEEDHDAGHEEDSNASVSGDESPLRQEPCSPGASFFEGDRPAPPRYILTSALDSTIRLWETYSGRCLRTFFGHLEGVWALSADTLRIVSGAEDRMVKIWDPRTGKCERTFTGHSGPVTCVGLGDSCFVTGSEDCEVRIHSFKN